ncbi:Stub1 protein [Polychytrium aggregatum]|uniref:Stub1 protein n=1 Tax=Polychytrium aggregatum TaxID=110093 RepID=UPI0022FF34D0|nr:Stub1 protein [Polychytrium aggregatum]KAI9207255.1 Stub1 protein [Polychytrium aggregatum]
MTQLAELRKQEGNQFFQDQLYEKAIQAYTSAIIHDNGNAVYYTNRALCRLKLYEYTKARQDCERAIELNPKAVKAWYFLGQALLEDDESIERAVVCLEKAHQLAIETKMISFVKSIDKTYLQARKKKWERAEQRRRERENSLLPFLKQLIVRERDSRLQSHVADTTSSAEELVSPRGRAPSTQSRDERIAQVERLFKDLDVLRKQQEERRFVPDCFLGKIHFEVMTDPVVTPAGITYDRSEILEHLDRIGGYDPVSHTPLDEADLVPNRALKEAIDEYLNGQGWAVDY